MSRETDNDRVRATLKILRSGIEASKKLSTNGAGLILYRVSVFLGVTIVSVLLGLIVASVWRSEAALVGVSGRIDGVITIVAVHKERIDDHETRLRYVERRDR